MIYNLKNGKYYYLNKNVNIQEQRSHTHHRSEALAEENGSHNCHINCQVFGVYSCVRSAFWSRLFITLCCYYTNRGSGWYIVHGVGVE